MTTTTDLSSAAESSGCCGPDAPDESSEKPVTVCSLPAGDQLERLEAIRNGLLPEVTAQRELADGYEWEFAAGLETRAKLDEFAAFERKCCSTLDWSVIERGGDAVALRVEGPDARAALAAFFDPGSVDSPAKLLTKAAGFGVGGALLVCCVLPIGGVALLGAVAAPLAGLDHPLVIAATSLVFGAGAWFISKRRNRQNPRTEAACRDC